MSTAPRSDSHRVSRCAGTNVRHRAVPLQSTLSAAPRAVPASFVVAEALPFRPSYLWILFFVGAAPIALWIARPLLFGVVGFGTVAAIYASRLRATKTRLALLKWGSVATVVEAERIGEMPSYSGRTWFNGYAPVARGWSVTRDRESQAQRQDPNPLLPGRLSGRLDADRTRIHRRCRAGRSARSGYRVVRDGISLRPRRRRVGQLGRDIAAGVETRNGCVAVVVLAWLALAAAALTAA